MDMAVQMPAKKNDEELGMSVDGGIADVANELVTKSSGKKSKK